MYTNSIFTTFECTSLQKHTIINPETCPAYYISYITSPLALDFTGALTLIKRVSLFALKYKRKTNTVATSLWQLKEISFLLGA